MYCMFVRSCMHYPLCQYQYKGIRVPLLYMHYTIIVIMTGQIGHLASPSHGHPDSPDTRTPNLPPRSPNTQPPTHNTDTQPPTHTRTAQIPRHPASNRHPDIPDTWTPRLPRTPRHPASHGHTDTRTHGHPASHGHTDTRTHGHPASHGHTDTRTRPQIDLVSCSQAGLLQASKHST